MAFNTTGWFIGTLLLPALLFAFPASALTQDFDAYREDYGNALQAIDRGSWTEYQQMRPGLEDYPLAIYLDYFQLSRQAYKVRPQEANRFISRSGDSPLPNRFLRVYLRRAGKDQRWSDFLQVMPSEPNSIDLKCFYFRAQLAEGNSETAWEGAQRLWSHGKSQPDECDPLFEAWQKAGRLDDRVVWTRMLNAFEARQGSLMRYVAKKGSGDLKPWTDMLMAVYRKPETLPQQTLPSDSDYSVDIAGHGLRYLARYSPEKALAYWSEARGQLDFSTAQAREVEYAIALHSLFARTQAHIPWLDDALDRLDDDKLVEIRLRWTLSERDWSALELNLNLLSPEGREEGAWRYWRVIALERRGESDVAKEALRQLATERSYYGFLAADKLGQPYRFNHQELEAPDTAPLRRLPAVQRIGELQYHEEDILAHAEWYKVLQDAADPDRQQELAQLASSEGWHRMAIDAANQARAWDSLDLRFPTPYLDVFKTSATAQRVPRTELMAIARRESAFYPAARSPVGARGLMQIMPATGKQVASSIGEPHSNADLYEVEHNVLLGSTYYRQLLDRFDGNRVFALTAYNAGPHRVDRWRSKGGKGLPVEIWIETIPYRETRNYVQAVLAYNVVFQYLTGDAHRLLTPAEQQADY